MFLTALRIQFLLHVTISSAALVCPSSAYWSVWSDVSRVCLTSSSAALSFSSWLQATHSSVEYRLGKPKIRDDMKNVAMSCMWNRFYLWLLDFYVSTRRYCCVICVWPVNLNAFDCWIIFRVLYMECVLMFVSWNSSSYCSDRIRHFSVFSNHHHICGWIVMLIVVPFFVVQNNRVARNNVRVFTRIQDYLK
jgi:hypothetical protein